MNKLFAAIASVALLIGASAHAGIANTKHNLSPSGTGENKVTAGTDELCVFCHTPHAADTSAPVPLWNKKLPAGTGYTTYATLNSSTIDGKILNVGSISLACLSCHDGTQAMDNIINAPGSGGYDATGGGANGLGYTWAGARVDATGKMINDVNTLAMLSTDLSNDHPIGIQYCGGGQSITTPTGACTDKDFNAPSTGNINGNRVWWVDTNVTGGTAGARDKSDMILYTRDFGGTIGQGPSVECGSCHDPHVEQTAGGVAGQTFLRIANTGSAVCLACHNK
jgi:doubled CXXCH motif protein